MEITTAIKKLGLEQIFRYVYKDPEQNLPKLMDWADKFSGGGFQPQRALIREIIENPDHPYHQFILSLLQEIDRDELQTLAVNFFVNAALKLSLIHISEPTRP